MGKKNYSYEEGAGLNYSNTNSDFSSNFILRNTATPEFNFQLSKLTGTYTGELGLKFDTTLEPEVVIESLGVGEGSTTSFTRYGFEIKNYESDNIKFDATKGILGSKIYPASNAQDFIQRDYVDTLFESIPDYDIYTVATITQGLPGQDVVYFHQIAQNSVLLQQFTMKFKNTASSNIKVTASGVDNEDVQFSLVDDPNIVGNLTIGGNLIVQGTTTTFNTEELNIEDNVITLNSNVTGTPVANAGIEVKRGTSPKTSVIWNEVSDKWTFTNDGTTYHDLHTNAQVNTLIATAIAAIPAPASNKEINEVTDLTVGNTDILHSFGKDITAVFIGKTSGDKLEVDYNVSVGGKIVITKDIPLDEELWVYITNFG